MANGRLNVDSEFVNRDGAPRSAPVFGIAIHTTGSGVVEGAERKRISPLQYARQIYSDPDAYYAHYVVGWDGSIIQIADENVRAPHIGLSGDERDAFLDGGWEDKVSSTTYNLWRARWPTFKSPSHLYPGTSPNNVFVGIELIPTVQRLYTDDQYASAGHICSDVAIRWGLPFIELLDPRKARIVGHEDVNPIRRHDAGGGWDPGAMRLIPRFSYEHLREQIATFLPNN